MLYFAVSNVFGTIVMVCMLFSFYTFTQMFMVNNIIKKYILEPSLEKSGVKEEEKTESVFDDNLKIVDNKNLN